MLINFKMSTVVGIFTFMSKIDFMLSVVEHEKSFTTSGPDMDFRLKDFISIILSHIIAIGLGHKFPFKNIFS